MPGTKKSPDSSMSDFVAGTVGLSAWGVSGHEALVESQSEHGATRRDVPIDSSNCRHAKCEDS